MPLGDRDLIPPAKKVYRLKLQCERAEKSEALLDLNDPLVEALRLRSCGRSHKA